MLDFFLNLGVDARVYNRKIAEFHQAAANHMDL